MNRPWSLYSIDELNNLPDPTWMVDGIFPDGLTVLYGPSGKGKTFMALSWALSIASGATWCGRRVQESPVLYVSGEGHGGLKRRIAAWRQYEYTYLPNMYVIPQTVVLTDREHVRGLAEDIYATKAKLVVIDTWARSMAGSNENSAEDTGLAVQGLDWIKQQTGCAALVIHHAGHEGHMRGSTALYGAADCVIKLTADGPHIVLTCDKQKDAAAFYPREFELTEAGESCIITASDYRPRGFIAGA